MKKKIDHHEVITQKVISLIEQGVTPWLKHWQGNPPQNAISNHTYQGANPLICAIEMLVHDWEHPYFLSYKQAEENGIQIKKGEKAIYLRWGGAIPQTEIVDGEEKITFRSFGKFHPIFNIAQCDGNTDDIINNITTINSVNPDITNIAAENVFANIGADVTFGGDVAAYSSRLDKICIPRFKDFTSATAFYSTMAHEHIHWTGHQSRLSRKLGNNFGTKDYAFEELIAELGAVFFCNDIGLDYLLEHHASYLASWMSVLKQDNKAFLKAAGFASTAAKYLTEISDNVNTEKSQLVLTQ